MWLPSLSLTGLIDECIKWHNTYKIKVGTSVRWTWKTHKDRINDYWNTKWRKQKQRREWQVTQSRKKVDKVPSCDVVPLKCYGDSVTWF